MNECSLTNCREGHSGLISKVEGHHSVTARLNELGFVPGEWIRVIRTGNPVIVQVGDSRFCLRLEQIHGISIIPAPSETETSTSLNGINAEYPSSV